MASKIARIITCINQKGGVSKSTTSEALADGLTLKRYRTLLIDLDPQGSVSLTSGADPTRPTIYEVLIKQCTAHEATQHHTQQVTHEHTQQVKQKMVRADIIPASPNLVKIEKELTGIGQEYHLKKQIEQMLEHYDYIIIDTPPALGLLTINALTASDLVIIPAMADVYSMQGIHQLSYTVEAIKEYTNPELKLAGILLTRHNVRSIVSKDMTEDAKDTADKIETFVYKTVIREGVAVKEAQAQRMSIFEYAPKSNPTTDYRAFVDEFLQKERVLYG